MPALGPSASMSIETYVSITCAEVFTSDIVAGNASLVASVPLGGRGPSVVMVAVLEVLRELSPSKRIEAVRLSGTETRSQR